VTDLSLALAAAARARTLVADLDRTDTKADRHQVAAGVRYELDTILRVLHSATQELVADAVGDRAGKVRSDAPATSRAAASTVLRPGTQRHRILASLARDGAQTDYELQQRLEIDPSAERPRRGELVDAGLVAEAGFTRHHQGRDWNVWKVTQRGQNAYPTLVGDTGSSPVEIPRQAEDMRLF
jgi:hypothetical protein